MNTKAILAIATFAAIASGAARADDITIDNTPFHGTRTRAEVKAEAARVPTTRSTEPAGSRVQAPVQSTVDARVVRAQAAEAVRLGQISHGEASM
jgi:hypothetical protein